MKVFGLAGWSGSGKTTLVKKLLPELISRGVRVSTMKHAHHNFDIDTPGKDSYEHRMAGATEVMVGSGKRWALMHELRNEPEPSVEDLIAAMTPVDLLLIEGFKHHPHAKLEVHRQATGKPLLWETDKDIVAIASDVNHPAANIPRLDIDDVAEIATFILRYTELLKPEPDHGAA